MIKHLFIIFCFAVVGLNGKAQTGKFPASKQEKLMFEEAEFYVNENDFEKAFELYKKLDEGNPNQPVLLFRMGFCKQQMGENDEDVLAYYTRVEKNALKGGAFPFYYGLMLHKTYKFEEAIAQMNDFIANSKPSKELKEQALKTIRYCENGIELVKSPAQVTITTLGDPLNTQFSEYAPMISADEKTVVYTYRGEKSTGGLQVVPGTNKKEYNEDIQIAYKDSLGMWYEPLLLQSNINTEGNDACVSITPDAQYMYLFRSIDNDPGSLYGSELDGMTWTDPEFLKGDVNSKWWDGSITMSHDGRKVFFSSERPGGLGGRDIYESRRKNDGTWGTAKNIGTVINTKENDDAPFLHPSGKYLVFSSEGHNSMGGFDIFVSELKADSTWDIPKNIGYPINSPTDDKFYTVTSDGKKGYYSSGKKGGLGKQDIYLVEPGIDKNVVLVQVTGDVYLNDIPTFAEIQVLDNSIPPLLTRYNSNSMSGKFLITLPPGKNYKIKFVIGGLEPKEFEINAMDLNGFEERKLNVRFYDKTFDPSQDDSVKTTTTPVKDSLKTTTTTTTQVEKDTTFKIMPMSELVEFTHPDLVYRVQVGAYRFPKNFRVEKFERDERSKQEMLNDGITRFTIKQFTTLREAYAYKDEMIKLGVTDAFVTAVFKGKRYLLVEIRPVLMEVLKYEPK